LIHLFSYKTKKEKEWIYMYKNLLFKRNKTTVNLFRWAITFVKAVTNVGSYQVLYDSGLVDTLC
jgi:hypothetical protein